MERKRTGGGEGEGGGWHKGDREEKGRREGGEEGGGGGWVRCFFF